MNAMSIYIITVLQLPRQYKSAEGEGGVHQGCLQVRVMLLHGVGSVVQHQRAQRVKLVRGREPVPAPRVPEHWDPLELASVSVRHENDG